jgi:hypothetical protein
LQIIDAINQRIDAGDSQAIVNAYRSGLPKAAVALHKKRMSER